jgi:hypothetical protein
LKAIRPIEREGRLYGPLIEELSGENRSLSSAKSTPPGEMERWPESESVDLLERVGEVGALPTLFFLLC